MIQRTGFLLVLFLLTFPTAAFSLSGNAQKVFEQTHDAVFQIRVVDDMSHEKSVIGSGFRFSDEGLFATNFHVISDVVDKPEQFRIEYHREGKKVGALQLEAIDVAHDLAILKTEPSKEPALALSTAEPDQGDSVFPMGNPLDVGMVILEGTYNGQVGIAPYRRILLSASLNSGMSGGPAFDSKGRVIGVNVSIQGNDLSYLVPIRYLVALEKNWREHGQPKDWRATVQRQVLDYHSHLITQTLSANWTYENYGSLKVPKKMLPSLIKCWGKSRLEDPEKNRFFFYGYKWCESEDDIFLSSSLSTGTMGYAFFWLESESLSALPFYKKLSELYSQGQFYADVTEEEAGRFHCQDHFVTLASQNWKGAYCVRRYKKYPELHDVYLSFALLNDAPRKYMIKVGLSGLSEPLAHQFLKKFLGGIEWVE